MSSRPIPIATVVTLLAVMLAVGWAYVKASRPSVEPAPWPFVYPTADIAPGTHRWTIDAFQPSRIEVPRSILFVRKRDGTLGAWYFQRLSGYPAAPFDNLLPLGTKCDVLEVLDAEEQIRCSFTNRQTNAQLDLTWNWSGKSLGMLAPDLQPVPGRAEGNSFVLAPEAVDPQLLDARFVRPK